MRGPGYKLKQKGKGRFRLDPGTEAHSSEAHCGFVVPSKETVEESRFDSVGLTGNLHDLYLSPESQSTGRQEENRALDQCFFFTLFTSLSENIYS